MAGFFAFGEVAFLRFVCRIPVHLTAKNPTVFFTAGPGNQSSMTWLEVLATSF
jgi:hypothetical protein